MEDAVLTRPKTEPECLGAKSRQLVTVPNLWKDEANMAKVTRPKATENDLTEPETEMF